EYVTNFSTNSLNQVYKVIEAGQREKQTYYDDNNRVTRTRVQEDSGVFVDYDSTYDSLDRRTLETVTVDGVPRTARLVYDDEGRVKGKIRPVGNAVGYKYDWAGRQIESRVFAKPATLNPTVLPTEDSADAVTTTTYDDEGNPVEIRNPEG